MAEKQGQASSVVRVLTKTPERIAAGWRRFRFAQSNGDVPKNLLDGLVDEFISEIGLTLARKKKGRAWSRTAGVLRLSPARGFQPLFDEFDTLRRCLLDAVLVCNGTANERRLINDEVDYALESAIAHLQYLSDPTAKPPRTPFGGIIIELFERNADDVRRAEPEPRLGAG